MVWLPTERITNTDKAFSIPKANTKVLSILAAELERLTGRSPFIKATSSFFFCTSNYQNANIEPGQDEDTQLYHLLMVSMLLQILAPACNLALGLLLLFGAKSGYGG